MEQEGRGRAVVDDSNRYQLAKLRRLKVR